MRETNAIGAYAADRGAEQLDARARIWLDSRDAAAADLDAMERLPEAMISHLDAG